jgi:glycosyltransferase involved in cell wall biosynthesis
LKILEVCSAYPPSRGGVERFVQELSRGLVQQGHQVTVLTSSRGMESKPSDRVGPDGIRVIRYPEHFHLFEAPLIPSVSFRILGMDFDVLHVHGMSPTITDLSVLMGKIKRKPVVVTYHNDAETTMDWNIADAAAAGYAWLSVGVLGLANTVVCSTRSYAESSPVLSRIPGRFVVVPLGVESGRFSGRATQSAGETKGKLVLFVGQLKDYKGVDVLIRAIAKLRAEGNDISLRVVGEGPRLVNYRRTADGLRLNGGVKFLGNVDDEALIDLYSQCDLFVLPSTSRREAFGLVQLEAVAAGKRVVGSDIPGAGEVTRMIDGFLVKPNDHVALAQEILRAVSMPHDREMLQEKARFLSWTKVVSSYDKIFESLVQPRRN